MLEATVQAVRDGTPATLALVVGTEGSTYVEAGAAALFAPGATTGWLSGGCLEGVVAARAREVAQRCTVTGLELDTRDDEAMFSGSASGCRGLLRLALVPTRALAGLDALVEAWKIRGAALAWRFALDGAIEATCGDVARTWRLEVDPVPGGVRVAAGSIRQAPPLRVLACGAGPEAAVLFPLLRTLGMVVTAIEQRPRWRAYAHDADAHHALAPRAGVEALAPRHDAALVMHHAFERDFEALDALAHTPLRYVGLLGPKRRRDELLALLGDEARAALGTRLEAPIGLDLGGRGPEAIALGVAAALQQLQHRRA